MVDNGDETTTVKTKEGVTYTVTKGGTEYKFTANNDGTFTYTDDSNPTDIIIYNVTVNPGTLTTYANKVATIKSGEDRIANGELTVEGTDGKSYSITGTSANNDNATLLTDVLTV